MVVKTRNLEALRKKLHGKRIVFAGGCFDLLHLAHIRALRNLHRYGDVVFIGVVSDERVRERKGKERPVFPLKDRIEIIDSIRFVDYTCALPKPKKGQPGRSTLMVLKRLRPNTFVTVDIGWIKYKKAIERLGIKMVVLARRSHSVSTTKTIEMVLEKYRDNRYAET